MEFSIVERLLLRNQYAILAQVGAEAEQDYNLRMVKILEQGFESEYSDLTEVFSKPFSKSQGSFVVEVLDMFTAFEWAKEKGVQPPQNGSLLFTFRGFDGNDEYPFMSYAKFHIEQEGRWESLKGKSLNSHTPMVERYSELISLWKQSAETHDLTADDFKRITAAVLREVV